MCPARLFGSHAFKKTCGSQIACCLVFRSLLHLASLGVKTVTPCSTGLSSLQGKELDASAPIQGFHVRNLLFVM